jgi:hypothetical protein
MNQLKLIRTKLILRPAVLFLQSQLCVLANFLFKISAMKKLRDDKITASRKLAVVPDHSYSNFIISVSQAAAHWLQRQVRQGLVFWYSKMRLVACGQALQPTALVFA